MITDTKTLNKNNLRMLNRVIKNPSIIIGGGLLCIIILMAIFAPLLTSYHPLEVNIAERLTPPNLKHLFGTDSFGRDLFSRVLWGSRTSLLVSFAATVFAGVLGVLFGLIAGYYQKADQIIMRASDGIMAFPGILLALTLMSIFGPSMINVIFAIGIVYAPRCARVVRGSVLTIQPLEYIEAAKALGNKDRSILIRHILPNCLAPLIVQLSITFAFSVLSEAGLSFLGAGNPPPDPSWGNILSEGRDVIWTSPWVTFYSGMAIFITVLALNILGDGLRDAFDPRYHNKVKRPKLIGSISNR
jgi:peptide/nickel transport system permease protein